ncbi:hypothetical protein JHK85_044241 [Glycine max]|nr:hypothetical protein JHK85_044241 [Glycine max]
MARQKCHLTKSTRINFYLYYSVCNDDCPIYKDQCNNSALSTKQWSSFPAKSKNVP